METIQTGQTMADDTIDEVEMLPEYSPPHVNFVVVLPTYQKEVFSVLDHTEKLQEVQERNSKKEESQKKDMQTKKKQLKEAKSKTYYSPRRFFTDSWNSLWHFVFGVLAIKFKLFVPLFIFYQCIDISEENIFVDIWEFLIGYVFGYVFYMI